MKTYYLLFAALLLVACNSAKKAERNFGEALFQHWVHSYEDDQDGYRAFRPAGYEFPPARGREGFELKKDGTFTHHQIGPVDAPVQVVGKWEMKDKTTLKITPAEPGAEPWEMQVVEAAKDMLKIKS
jgi:hypothetical protein